MIENLTPIYDLFFGTMYNPHLYPNHMFLSLAQALESYHGRTFDSNIMPNELFKEAKAHIFEIINRVPGKYRQQLEPKVAFDINRKTFRKRVKELFDKYGHLFGSFINDKNTFIAEVVDTRNYYTHYPPELEARAAKLKDLPFLSQSLRFILIVILLKEIGFSDRLTEQALTRYMRFRIRRIT